MKETIMAMPIDQKNFADTSTTYTGEVLDKLPAVLARTGYSRSRWYQGIKNGELPKPVKLGTRSVAWKRSEIDRLIESLAYAD